MAELQNATRAALAGEPFAPKVLPHPYAFNLFSHDTAVDPATGYNQEELKVIAETKKIFADPDIQVGVTCIRVPVQRPCDRSDDRMRAADRPARGTQYSRRRARGADRRRPGAQPFSEPAEASGQDDILVGRIRRDMSDPAGGRWRCSSPATSS